MREAWLHAMREAQVCLSRTQVQAPEELLAIARTLRVAGVLPDGSA